MGIKSWGITTKILTQRKEQGGVELVMPSVYLRHLHSKYYVQYVSHPDSVPRVQKEEFERWRGPALGTTLARTTMNWTRQPVQAGTGARKAWTSLATSAKAYRQEGRTGGHGDTCVADAAHSPPGQHSVPDKHWGEL